MSLDYESTDPLAIVTAPPPNETPREKAARQKREAEAQRISDQIDGQLYAEKVALEGQKRTVNILLLGQNGDSGKAALLRHLLLVFARDKWIRERDSWKIVLWLKLVQSANTILEALQAALDDEGDDTLSFTDKHRRLRLKLRPLCGVESYLMRLLSAKEEDVTKLLPNTSLSPNTPFKFYGQGRNWRSSLRGHGKSGSEEVEGSHSLLKLESVSCQDAIEALWTCKNHIRALWTDPVVREMMQRSSVRIDEVATFCLDNSERLSARDYEPTDDDIINVSLCTPGVREYVLNMSQGERPDLWKIYDLGASQTRCHAWLPYFDQVNSIVFLVPISCFDEQLREDPNVNRLEHAFIQWKAICSSGLLTRTNLILLLHDIEDLANKIANGVVVKRYILSYGDRPNDTLSVVKYLRQKFKDTLRLSPLHASRSCHIYFEGTIVDVRTTEHIVHSVRTGILREYISNAGLL